MFYRQPRYFTNFNCTGGDCPDNCCHGWNIDWTAEEVEKLKSVPNMSQELRDLIDLSFIPLEEHEGHYLIQFDRSGNCPCLTEDKFCRIQRELGAEYLSKVCMVYPRHYIITDRCAYRFCNMSCFEVMNKLLNDEKSMDLINTPLKETVTLSNVTRDPPVQLKEHPELKYRNELMEFFYEIIADKKRSVEDSLVLGALAAQKFSQYVEDGNYDLIPDAITAFKKQSHDPEQLKKIVAIKPNYNVKLGILSKIYGTLSALNDDTGNLNVDLYLQGEKRLAEAYKDRPFCFRNIALNLLLEFAVPFQFTHYTIFENYSIFVASFAIFKLIAIDISELTKKHETSGKIFANQGIGININVKVDTDSYVHKACTLISRTLCHNPQNAKSILKFLQDKKMLSPAYLALLVK